MNYMTIVIAAVLDMVLGALWYSPVLFGKQWMKLTGKNMNDMGSPAKAYTINFIGALILAAVLSYLIKVIGINTLSGGAKLGFIAGLGFIATTMLPDYLYTKRPMKLFVINVSYQWLAAIIMGALIANF